MTGVPAGVTGLALVCDFDGAVIEVPWDDLGLVSAATDLSHVACLLDPGSVQKGLALFLFVKENGAAFGWELNLATPDGPRHLHFSGTVLRDRVVLLAAEHPQEIGQVYDGLSHVINEQINAMRSLHKRAAGGRGRAHGEGAPKEQFDREMVQDLLRLNNRLVNAERELARKNSELKRLSSVLSKDLHLAHRVVQCSGEAVVVADRERRVVDVNQAYTAMTGFAPHEVLRTPLHLTSSEHHDPAFEEEIWGAVDQRGGWQGECVGTRPQRPGVPEVAVRERGARRRRQGRPLRRDLLRHHALEGRRGTLAAPGVLRQPHPAAEPRAVQGPAPAGDRPGPPGGGAAGPHVHRPRRLQAGQRQPRPRCGATTCSARRPGGSRRASARATRSRGSAATSSRSSSTVARATST
jgi:PAS domain-containing protein